MAARGTMAKQQVTDKLLEAFPGAFIFGKEIRIPWTEAGEVLQIKCALTCAKENVEPEGEVVTPVVSSAPVEMASDTGVKASVSAPSEDEKAKVAELLKRLNL